MTLRRRFLKTHPAALVLLSFLLAILAGTGLLMLPAATRGGLIPPIDALFTATSAVCVTGLIVVDTGAFFTGFGQAVILGLIQIGGIGVMTLSVTLFRWLGATVPFHQRMILQDLFCHTPREDIYGLLKSVLIVTFLAESIGVVLLAAGWAGTFPLPELAWMALFHAVSAFCNAGFALFPDSMTPWAADPFINGAICGLIIVGGIGFPVIDDLRRRLSGRPPARLSIQTRTVLWTSGALILGGAAVFGVLEWRSLAASPSIAHRLLAPVFQSVTCRTAGFNTVDIGGLQDATLAMMIFLMFFGASPGSCGGGVKTTTLALMAAFTWSRMRRRCRVNLFKKSVPPDTVKTSASLILLSIGVIGGVLFALLAGETLLEPAAGGGRFLAYLFETVSAFGTVGLSTGITPGLSAWGKCWIIFMMILGRVGMLTFAYGIVGRGPENGVVYSEENLMIG